MDAQANAQPPHRQVVMHRFVAACQADARVVAAFLGGSYARGTADAYSDLDLGLITTDAAYEDFYAGRAAFLRLFSWFWHDLSHRDRNQCLSFFSGH